jgi:hypothetical protein
MVIDAQNLGTLVGAVDLSLLPRLKEALFGGTNVKTIGLPSGSKIERFQIPDSLTALDMQNLKFLSEEGFEFGTLGNIEFFRIENCDNIDKFALMKSMYLAEGSKLKNVRVIGFDYEGDANDVTMVANMAIDKDKDGNEHHYNGINQEGQIDEEMLPVIEGRLKVNGSIYEDDGKVLKQYYPNLTLEVTGGYYVKFADPEVQRICATNWGDGTGITEEQVESVTTLGYTFQKSSIVTFDDAYKFVNVTKLEASGFGYGGAFNRCTSLTSITLPTSITEIQNGSPTYGDGDGAFFEATSLVSCLGLGNVSYFGDCSFYNCPALTEVDIDWNKVTYIGEAAFVQCKINVDKLAVPNLKTLGVSSLQGIQTKVVADLGKITSLPYHWYSKLFCDNVECVVLPDTLTSMETHSMYMDSGFKTLVMKAITPPTIQSNTFMQLPSSAKFYVPDASVEAYKTATNWSTYASRIKGISELPTDNAELYEEIKEYLN